MQLKLGRITSHVLRQSINISDNKEDIRILDNDVTDLIDNKLMKNCNYKPRIYNKFTKCVDSI
jgi:hypothetical protein